MAVPHARDDHPWSDCGDPKSPDIGTVFADLPFEGSVGLWFDRAMEQRFACRVAVCDLGDEIVLHGRRFDVARPDAETVARAERALAAAEPAQHTVRRMLQASVDLLPELPCAGPQVRVPAPSSQHSHKERV